MKVVHREGISEGRAAAVEGGVLEPRGALESAGLVLDVELHARVGVRPEAARHVLAVDLHAARVRAAELLAVFLLRE